MAYISLEVTGESFVILLGVCNSVSIFNFIFHCEREIDNNWNDFWLTAAPSSFPIIAFGRH